MTSVFSMSVFEATITVGAHDFFKGQGAASLWAERVSKETGKKVVAKKVGNGWALSGMVDDVEVIWGIFGQRLKRVD
jgi:hypothetical protein